MTSVVEICNMALSSTRAGSINDINESSLQAQQCKLWYSILRDKCLRETNWNFARKIIALAPVTDVVFNKPYAYRYPNDCLKIERLVGSYEQVTTDSSSIYWNPSGCYNGMRYPEIPYDIYNIDSKKIIGTFQDQLRIDYTANVTDPTLFTVEFVLALSNLLTSAIAIPIIGVKEGRAIRSDALTLYNSYLNSALASDSNEKQHEPVESEFVTCRN